jgi:DNA/RNA endonuclease YhcR with UshA esterase domain
MNKGNQLLEPVPVQAEAVVLTNPATGQQALAFTIRHQAGEITVFLSREQGETWRDMIDAKLAKMTTLVTAPPGDPLPFPGYNLDGPGFAGGRRPPR